MVTNGQIDLRQLEQIAPDRYVSPGCAQAWRGFSAAMGGLTVGTAADSCYRSLAWQEYRWAHQPPLAARPGTSNHGLGQAIDIGNYYRFSHTTLVNVGRRYGFLFDTPSEAWHIKYTGAPNYHPLTAGAGGTATPIDETEGIDMATDLIYYATGTAVTSKSGVAVIPESMWYQERPRKPLEPLSQGKAYGSGPYRREYEAFLYARGYGANTANVAAGRYPTNCKDIADLIDLRGVLA